MPVRQPSDDEKFMRIALNEARKGVGHTSPNPAVGAVIVKSGKIVARGFHKQAGLPHAEIEAFAMLAGKRIPARGATLYVTLEPCSTHGRTPPCVDAILQHKISRVVIGTLDPNSAHAGSAIKILKKAGIKVATGILEPECAALNPGFNKWIVTGMPFVIAKAGMTLDGRLTLPPGEGQWITGEASRKNVQQLRAQVDAILVGAETLRQDNPRLTVRGLPVSKQPWRVILTRTGNLPADAHVFTDEFRKRTLVFQKKSLRAVLKELGKKNITSVLIEGGMRVLGEAFDNKLVDRVCFYVAPRFASGPKVVTGGRGAACNEDALKIRNPHYRKIDNDLLLTGDL